ncbi:PDZ domain-containing protein [Virgibacillus senegalensis]|uniref:PDZ domain-containing protein n=1 Tax=Virgibacillus senegalensis TaxID=1499679 RepID=UPI00069CC0E2|nr:PDZ domain-containing protein [Virgibacillus senegalensis]
MINYDLSKTVNRTYIEASIEDVWWLVVSPEGSNSYQSDYCTTTGDPINPKPRDKYYYLYGDIENHSVVVEAIKPYYFRLADEYKSLLPDGEEIVYNLQTTYTLEEMEDSFVRLTIEIEGYDSQTTLGRWIRDCMEHSWRRAMMNIKTVLEIGLDLQEQFFTYPKIGVTIATNNELYHTETNNGVYVRECYPTGPAFASGLKQGDIILKLSGKEVNTYEEFVRAICLLNKGSDVQIEFSRKGEIHTITVPFSYDSLFTGIIDSDGASSFKDLRDQRKIERVKISESYTK